MGGKSSKAKKSEPAAAAPVVSSTIKVGDAVKSIYGTGTIDEVRADGTVVFILNNWELAYGSKVKCYLNLKNVEKDPSAAPAASPAAAAPASTPVVKSLFKVGDKVKSIYGHSTVDEVRPDGTVVFILKNWELAYGSKVKCFLNPEAVETDTGSADTPPTPPASAQSAPVASASASASVTSFMVGSNVITIYGKGVVLEVRANDYVVQLNKGTWELAYGQKPTLYLSESNLKEDPSESPITGGEKVTSIYGIGYVLSNRDKSTVIVESAPDVWSLAYKQLPRMFLDPSIVNRVTK